MTFSIASRILSIADRPFVNGKRSASPPCAARRLGCVHHGRRRPEAPPEPGLREVVTSSSHPPICLPRTRNLQCAHRFRTAAHKAKTRPWRLATPCATYVLNCRSDPRLLERPGTRERLRPMDRQAAKERACPSTLCLLRRVSCQASLQKHDHEQEQSSDDRLPSGGERNPALAVLEV